MNFLCEPENEDSFFEAQASRLLASLTYDLLDVIDMDWPLKTRDWPLNLSPKLIDLVLPEMVNLASPDGSKSGHPDFSKSPEMPPNLDQGLIPDYIWWSSDPALHPSNTGYNGLSGKPRFFEGIIYSGKSPSPLVIDSDEEDSV